ncbi:MAG: valine--pyruvate transaminase [Arenicellales bacterium]
MRYSQFGTFLRSGSGILRLMEDIDTALTGPNPMMLLGGGNPAKIPAVQQRFRDAMLALLEDGQRFEQMTGNYDGARGNSRFLRALAKMLKDQCGWAITPENIAITNGSQTSFYVLFHLFAGPSADTSGRKILLPMVPEYIGYTDVGMGEDLFRAQKPLIETSGDHEFKYRIDFDAIKLSPEIGAIAISRPGNPTGNVSSDDEIRRLRGLAKESNVPLILDCAYGDPFPGIVFPEIATEWDKDTIICLSLSKLGLPGVRTGIIIADKEIIQAVSGANAIMSLAPASFGPSLVTHMVEDGSILDMSRTVIRPYYENKSALAQDWIREAMGSLPCRIHRSEGAIFLWLWFEALPITSEELYQRLKTRGVLVVAGEHFFPGLNAPWVHRQECIRVSYALNPDHLQRGIKIIAEEVARAYAG